MARIAIVGVGAIGSVIAALLQSIERHELILCTRSPLSHLRVETPEVSIKIRYSNLTDPLQPEPVDWVIVATKAYDAPGAGAWVEHLCKQGAPVAVIQNGVGHREFLAPYVPTEQILPVIIDCPAERRAPESTHQRGPAELFIQADLLARSFAALFQGSTAQIILTDDFLSAAWRKLCINSAGSISALLDKPSGVSTCGHILLKRDRIAASVILNVRGVEDLLGTARAVSISVRKAGFGNITTDSPLTSPKLPENAVLWEV